MTPERNIFIALSKKTSLHYFLRVMPLNAAKSHNASPDNVNALLTSKTQRQLSEAVRDIGMLIDAQSFIPHRRVQGLDEFSSSFDKHFGSVDPKKLAHEMYLASGFGLRANQGENSPAACFDAVDNDILTYINELKKEAGEYVVIVEPIQDWMTVRNLLAIAASALALVTSETIPHTLENLGFVRFEKSGIGKPLYAIPFKCNAYYEAMSVTHPAKTLRLKMSTTDYLFWILEKDYERTVGKNKTVYGIGTDKEVGITTGPIATGISDESHKSLEEIGRNFYLFVVDNGKQEEMLNKVIAEIWNAIKSLHDDTGAEYGIKAEYFWQSAKGDRPTCGSTVSSLFYEVFHPENKRLISCKRCRGALLAPMRGPAREYCSDSCRVLASRKS